MLCYASGIGDKSRIDNRTMKHYLIRIKADFETHSITSSFMIADYTLQEWRLYNKQMNSNMSFIIANTHAVQPYILLHIVKFTHLS